MSIEWAMWFALGFLAAGILALLVMTAVWRRAVRLTTRRVLDAVPTEVETVRAETDFLRARHARDGRRFELALADLRRRNAEERLRVDRGLVEVDRLGEALASERTARSTAETDLADKMRMLAERDSRIAALETDFAAARDHAGLLNSALGERDDGIARLIEEHRRAVTDAAAVHEAAMAEQAAAHLAERTTLEGDLSDARIEAATRKTTVATLEAQIRSLRAQVAEAAVRAEDEHRARGLAEAAAAQERDRADRLDHRIERLVVDVADREDRADRTARELDRARQALVFANARVAAGGAEAPAGDNLLRSLEQLERRNHELEDRLAALGGKAVDGSAAPDGETAPEAAREDLKGALSDLAARIVHLTGLVEGASSPIERIVAGAPGPAGTEAGPSLADRIRELRRQAEETATAVGAGPRRG